MNPIMNKVIPGTMVRHSSFFEKQVNIEVKMIIFVIHTHERVYSSVTVSSPKLIEEVITPVPNNHFPRDVETLF